jgi:Fe-S-cluster containining protein
MPTYCLTLHAGYRCRHVGACCRTWAVAAEPSVIHLVEQRQIRRAGVTGPLFVSSAISDGAASWTVARDADGSCVFFDRDAGRLCVIHRDAGAEALPVACRHFPRKILRDGRGTFISLSHFCPTAAAMLLTPDGLDIVEAQPPLRLEEPVEGLDASDALPPLVRPGLLCDLDGYGAWERACIAAFARPDLTYREALDLIAAATETTRTWQPGAGTLAAHVEAAFQEAHRGSVSGVDAGTRASETTPSWLDAFDVAMKNYLAARVFANWIAYQGRGLRSIVEWLRTCAALVRLHAARLVAASGSRPGAAGFDADFIRAVRQTDHLLLHVADTAVLARRFAAVEGSDPT